MITLRNESERLEFIGLNDLEKEVDLSALDRDPRKFNGYSDVNTDLLNSEAFIAGFKEGYSKVTGIPTSELRDRVREPRRYPLANLRFSLERVVYAEPMEYSAIKAESKRLIAALRAVVNEDPRFKESYLALENRFQGETENDFAARIAGEPNAPELMQRYVRSERLMGEICAYLYLQNKLLRNYLEDLQEPSQTAKEEIFAKEVSGYRLLKIVLAQRWYKSELDKKNKSEDGRFRPKELADQTDAAFGRVIDYLIDRYGQDTVIFSTMLNDCIDQAHLTSEAYGVHTDAGSIDLEQTQDAKKAIGTIFPVIEKDYTNWRVINIEFLPGDEFFWRHLHTNHPDMYQQLVAVVQEAFKKPIRINFPNSEFNGIDMSVSSCHSLYNIMQSSFPEVLPFFPGSEKHEAQEDFYWQVKFDYEHALIMQPLDRKRILLDSWFDPLHID